QSGFRSLLKRINNLEEEDDTPIEGEALEQLKADLVNFINKIRQAEANEEAKDAKAELDEQQKPLAQLYAKVVERENDDPKDYFYESVLQDFKNVLDDVKVFLDDYENLSPADL